MGVPPRALLSALVWPYCGQTYFNSKRSVQRIVQVRQVRPGKSRKGQIRQQNRNECRIFRTWLLTSVIWYLFPSDENDENSKTGKDEQHKKVIMVIMGNIWQASLPLTLIAWLQRRYTHLRTFFFFSVNGNEFFVKTKLNSRIPLFFPYDSRIPSS